jgi:hypothetical protein
MSRWTHADGSTGHEVDPHYNGNGLPAFWTCHVKDCSRELRLDGAKVPITASIITGKAKAEPPLSAQP